MRALLLCATALVLAGPVSAAPQYGSYGFDTKGMDRAVKPGDDFFAYANGNWDRTTPIPADRSGYGVAYVLDDLSRQRTREIIEAAAANPGTSADAARVGTYYATFMDEPAIEAKGLAAIKPALDRIAAISTPAELATALGAAQRLKIPGPFGVGVEQDPKNPERYMAGMGQSGLGLPDRDYFLQDNPKFVEVRAKYVDHITRMFTLAGFDNARARAEAVFALEKALAEVQWTRVQNRDPVKTYNLRDPKTLAAEAPGLDWPAFLAAAGIGGETRLDVAQPSAFAGMAKLVGDQPLAVWKDYLALRVLKARAAVLPKAFVDENFAFNGTVLAGQPENQPRWKRGVTQVNAYMGEAVGKLYVDKYFNADAKTKIDALVKNLLAAMGARIDKAEWMSPATKQEARAKLATFNPKIGYPDKWRDYSALKVVSGDAVGNADRANAFDYDRDLAKLGGPLDRSEWFMAPTVVNAYYNPPMNEVVFPAAILQPPFFDPQADPAVNYGGIGAVIGHEISHGFDDQGRQYDAKGALRDWWTAADNKAFTERAKRLVAQYNAYEPLKGSHINGELTLGENIADIAGLQIAHDAWLRSLDGKPAPVIDGMTGEQRFFLGYAQAWRGKVRDAALLSQLTSDPHSPNVERADTVRNMDAWYDAFGVKPGDKLYLAPKDRVHIW
ncbi:M13 family metallopeptidase [Polymorphobacter fuscus]|uniref:M13 family peptidase n=1 Tax=Sandarakinorhabdus fusca TaxID=1439888 RepID=A0A7C9GRM6_9SPHN|nr:M13 family metallopeptidase [Polymorphobacter fuscus]KAB7643889.1 M13 family metallopeptidase [Polymorphobacter fuscus]MQT18590.1 M13 family peptidase [Polymorphobacter fuscus]NJC07042.1 putative endopeptidase [Polymorphobacter fuscus]